MPLLRHRKVISTDAFRFVPDEELLPDSVDVLISLQRLLAHAPALADQFAGPAARLGVRLEPEDDVTKLAPHLEMLELVAIHFPKFSDGRGYSHARLLRDRFGYRGELRAVGEVLGDQLLYMRRCGMDSFELVEGKDVALAVACLDDFSVTYQADADEPRPLYRRVARGRAAHESPAQAASGDAQASGRPDGTGQ